MMCLGKMSTRRWRRSSRKAPHRSARLMYERDGTYSPTYEGLDGRIKVVTT